MRRGRGGTKRGGRRWAIASVNLEPRLLERTDGLAALRGVSRSRLVREALVRMLEEPAAR
jgi:metal-responsive CopG/Arc/MetJ family transcriptional regulator